MITSCHLLQQVLGLGKTSQGLLLLKYLNSQSDMFSEEALILSDPTDFLFQLFSLLIGLLLYKLHLFTQLHPQSHQTILMFLLQLAVKQHQQPKNKLPSHHTEVV